MFFALIKNHVIFWSPINKSHNWLPFHYNCTLIVNVNEFKTINIIIKSKQHTCTIKSSSGGFSILVFQRASCKFVQT